MTSGLPPRFDRALTEVLVVIGMALTLASLPVAPATAQDRQPISGRQIKALSPTSKSGLLCVTHPETASDPVLIIFMLFSKTAGDVIFHQEGLDPWLRYVGPEVEGPVTQVIGRFREKVFQPVAESGDPAHVRAAKNLAYEMATALIERCRRALAQTKDVDGPQVNIEMDDDELATYGSRTVSSAGAKLWILDYSGDPKGRWPELKQPRDLLADRRRERGLPPPPPVPEGLLAR